MAHIRYVVISDLHLGASNSVLTAEPLGGATGVTARPLELLAACLRELARTSGGAKPTLIVNGDLLELALTSIGRATRVFDDLLGELLADGEWPFDPHVIFLAGNHDHHLWELAREAWYLDQVGRTPVLAEMPEASHVTNLNGAIGDHVVSDPFLSEVLSRRPETAHCTVSAAYPNFAARSADGSRAVVFHHGHFIEAIYSLVSDLRGVLFQGTPAPQNVEELEAENFAWIDFFWSTLGRSGAAGQDIFLIYDKLHDWTAVKSLMHGFATGMLQKRHGREWMKRLETDVLQGILDATLGRVARFELHQSGQPLSAGATAGMHTYVEGPLRQQIVTELGDIPRELTLIMGHTHKPFETLIEFAGYETPVPVYNSGGYVVDTPTPEHCHGGAIVVVDDDLNTASVRVYYEPWEGNNPSVRIATAGGGNPLASYLESAVQAGAAPWSDFLREGSAAALLCRARMQRRIEESAQAPLA